MMRSGDSDREAMDRLVRGHLHDPHSVLGPHPAAGGTLIRAYRPDAGSIAVVTGDGVAAKLDKVHPDGVFEGVVEGLDGAYELEITYSEGATFTVKDPYAFEPTLGELDTYLAQEGKHRRLYERLGAHIKVMDGVSGTSFAVWAPNARSVRVVGEFNSWDGRLNPMRSLGDSGIWEIFVPDVGVDSLYKFEVLTLEGALLIKADPYAFAAEAPPGNGSIVYSPGHRWKDDEWMSLRGETDAYVSPMSIYEVHLGSWRRGEDGASLSYTEAARELADYCTEMGFTHVEFLPLAEHPFGGSWGYQVTSYYAPTARFGSPDDFKGLVDVLHQAGIGVIMDWVPAHFPKDEWALARFDGTALYEHSDPRRGEHPDWGTLVFNFGRNEIRNFLIGNALYWIEEMHVDGLRVDAVASMLYLDYSRKEGEWLPNVFGGNENLEAIDFLKELNEVVHAENPGVMMIAEESTSWPSVSRPVYLGGLGFGFKWNMGWMHDTLLYFTKEAIHRRFHHNNLTFSMVYAFSENFVLPLSHDEVVHGKGSLLNKMPGDDWQQFANLRALLAYMWAHPGKQLLFMGAELGQRREWSHDRSIDWDLLDRAPHAGLQRLVADLNRVYRKHPAMWQRDFSAEGFSWIDANDADNNVVSFYRSNGAGTEHLVCVANLSPVVREGFRVGMPKAGTFTEVLNTDAEPYGGSGVGQMGAVEAEGLPWHGQPASATLRLPPLAVTWLHG